MKLFKFDSDATIVEKIATVFVPVFVFIVMLIAFGSVWGIFHNQLTDAAATASAGWHTLGTILFLVAVAWFIAGLNDSFSFKISGLWVNVVLGILIVLSLCAYCGFFVSVY